MNNDDLRKLPIPVLVFIAVSLYCLTSIMMWVTWNVFLAPLFGLHPLPFAHGAVVVLLLLCIKNVIELLMQPARKP